MRATPRNAERRLFGTDGRLRAAPRGLPSAGRRAAVRLKSDHLRSAKPTRRDRPRCATATRTGGPPRSRALGSASGCSSGRPRATGELDDTLLSKYARAADLLLRPDLVGRVRDRGRDGGAGRRARSRRSHLVFPISIAIAVLLAIVVALLQPGGPRLRVERRLVRLRAREPRHAAGARRRRRAADGLRAHRGRLGRGRRLRAHLGGAVARLAPASRSSLVVHRRS